MPNEKSFLRVKFWQNAIGLHFTLKFIGEKFSTSHFRYTLSRVLTWPEAQHAKIATPEVFVSHSTVSLNSSKPLIDQNWLRIRKAEFCVKTFQFVTSIAVYPRFLFVQANHIRRTHAHYLETQPRTR